MKRLLMHASLVVGATMTLWTTLVGMGPPEGCLACKFL